jgi:hypothetical protein
MSYFPITTSSKGRSARQIKRYLLDIGGRSGKLGPRRNRFFGREADPEIELDVFGRIEESLLVL